MIEGDDIAWRPFAAYAEPFDLRFPQLLDVADARLDDDEPQFSDEVWADWNQKLVDDFKERAESLKHKIKGAMIYPVVVGEGRRLGRSGYPVKAGLTLRQPLTTTLPERRSWKRVVKTRERRS